MDEKYSIYLNDEPTREDFYMGNIKGYVLDSMIADGDLYQFEQDCDYYSYEEILAKSDVIRPLLQVYRERELNGVQIRITNRNHIKDIFNARGFYVLKKNSAAITRYISDYENVFGKTQDEMIEAVDFYSAKKNFCIHRGDFVLFDVNEEQKQVIDWEKYERQKKEALSKANMYRSQAVLSNFTANLMMDPGEAPMSAGNAALIGGALAGPTGAIIGAASGLNEQIKHNGYVNSYTESKQGLLGRAEMLQQKAQEMQEKALSDEYPYKTELGGTIYFGIRTFFGVLPAMFEYGFDKIRVGLKTLCWDIDINDIEDEIIKNSRWKKINSFLENGQYKANSDEKLREYIDQLYLDINDGYMFEEVLSKCETLLKTFPDNSDLLFIRVLAENKISSVDDAINKNFDITCAECYEQIIDNASRQLMEKVEAYSSAVLNHKKEIYAEAKEKLASAITDDDYCKVIGMFGKISNYEDSADILESCQKKLKEIRRDETYHKGISIIAESEDEENIDMGIKLLELIPDWRDAREQIEKGKEKTRRINRKRKLKKYGIVLGGIIFLIITAVLSVVLKKTGELMIIIFVLGFLLVIFSVFYVIKKSIT